MRGILMQVLLLDWIQCSTAFTALLIHCRPNLDSLKVDLKREHPGLWRTFHLMMYVQEEACHI